MREIKFRGFCLGTKKWIYGYLIIDDKYTQIWKLDNQRQADFPVIVDYESVGEYTGLKDCTKWKELTEDERKEWIRDGNMPSEWQGKEIYEGDFVKNTIKKMNFDNRYGEGYKYYEDFFDSVDVVKYNNKWTKFDMTKAMEWGVFKVIGNIYENPELLKGEQK
jgi:hypothetical protein